MSEQSPFPPTAEFDPAAWFPGGMPPRTNWAGDPMPPPLVVDEQGVALSLDDTLRVREQAVHSASMMQDPTPFPEDDAENVVKIAKRFEAYIRSGK